MFIMRDLTTGNEWDYNNFSDLVFDVINCYEDIDDNDLLCEILTNLVKLEKGKISNFSTENDKGLWIYRKYKVED